MSEQCAQKTALLLEFTRLTKAYSDVVTALHTAMGTISHLEYNAQYQVADEASATPVAVPILRRLLEESRSDQPA